MDELDQLEQQGLIEHREYCWICGRTPVDQHHWVHTRKARPDLVDEPLNIIPLCRMHHIEAHTLGRIKFYRKYGKSLPETYRDYFEQEVPLC